MWGLSSVTLSVCMDDVLSPEEPLTIARELWGRQDMWDDRIRDFAASKLLKLKNDSWLQEGEEPVTKELFKASLTPENITVIGKDLFDFYFHDGDLFWGHYILVSGDLQNGPRLARLEG